MSRIRPQNLTPTCSSPFMTTFAARVQEPIESALIDPALFADVRSNLRPGDQVALCEFEAGDVNKSRVLAYVTLVITQRTADGVEFEFISPIIRVGAAKPEPEAAKAEPEALAVEPDPSGGFIVKGVVSGHAHKHFKTRAAADRYAADYGGKAA